MEIQFAKINPTQNMTILVLNPVARSLQPQVAEKLMAYESVNAEQVGFLEPPTQIGARARLQMMGGEFCGNATMSLAAYFCQMDQRGEGELCNYTLEVSGADAPLRCEIQKSGAGFSASVNMPLPEKIECVTLPNGRRYPVVFLPGIAQIIVPAQEMDAEAAEREIARWCKFLNAEALGILLFDEAQKCIRPLVYVRATDSAVWERGCGSGTAAIGAYLASVRQANVSIDLAQPGGVIGADVRLQGGTIESIRIRSTVRIACMGSAWIEDVSPA